MRTAVVGLQEEGGANGANDGAAPLAGAPPTKADLEKENAWERLARCIDETPKRQVKDSAQEENKGSFGEECAV